MSTDGCCTCGWTDHAPAAHADGCPVALPKIPPSSKTMTDERLDVIKQSPRQADVTDVEDLCDEIERLQRENQFLTRNAAAEASNFRQLQHERDALVEDVVRLRAENQALRNLAENLKPGPISQAFAGLQVETPDCAEFVRMQHDICSRLGVDADTDSVDLHERALTAIGRLQSETTEGMREREYRIEHARVERLTGELLKAQKRLRAHAETGDGACAWGLETSYDGGATWNLYYEIYPTREKAARAAANGRPAGAFRVVAYRRAEKTSCRHPVTRTVTTEIRGQWKCLDCGQILHDEPPEKAPAPPSDTARLDWLQNELVDTIYLDDGRIIDVGGRYGGHLRNAIDFRREENGSVTQRENKL